MEKEEAVLVTGSSSWLGRSLVQELRQQGLSVVALYRNCLPEPQERVYPVWCDLVNPKLIPAALRGVETVFHLAWEGGVGDDVEAVNLKSLKNLIRGMEIEKIPHLVFVSALGSSRKSNGAFLRQKYEAEKLVLNSKVSKITIWKPAPLFGGVAVSDRLLRGLYNATRMPLLHPENQKGKISPLSKSDFLGMMIAQYRTQSSSVEIINVKGPEDFDVGEILYEVALRTRKGMSLGLKGPFGALLLRFLERDPRYTGRKLSDYSNIISNESNGYETVLGKESLKQLLQTVSVKSLETPEVIQSVSKAES